MLPDLERTLDLAKAARTANLAGVTRQLAMVNRELAEAQADLQLVAETNPAAWLRAERHVRVLRARAAGLSNLKAHLTAHRRDLSRSEAARQRNILRMKNADTRIH